MACTFPASFHGFRMARSIIATGFDSCAAAAVYIVAFFVWAYKFCHRNASIRADIDARQRPDTLSPVRDYLCARHGRNDKFSCFACIAALLLSLDRIMELVEQLWLMI